jgi:hypothetical protein
VSGRLVMSRRLALWLGLGLAGLSAIPCGFFGLWAAASGGSDKGSPALAAEWKADLSQYRTPEEAQAKNKDVIVVRFDDGAWVFGRCQSSHGVWKRGGGTVVVKDSKGRVRAFFGHVCGEGALGARWERYSLATYYHETLSTGFVEHPLP